MKIALALPASPVAGVVTGNDITARRWEAIFRKLGHDVVAPGAYADADVLVALHARKSAPSVRAFDQGPVVVALTGTDLYQDLPDDADAQESLRRASAIVALQPGALDRLEPEARAKTTIIYQSATPLPGVARVEGFQAAVVAHLRDVKNPFLAAEAVALLPDSSRLTLLHAGAAFSDDAAASAQEHMKRCARYRWLGPMDHDGARKLIAESHLFVLTSRFEGGANVLSEALAAGTPILATRSPGVAGLLGPTYPGLFEPEPDALSKLLTRAETDRRFSAELEAACRALAPLVDPELETRAWQQLLGAVSG